MSKHHYNYDTNVDSDYDIEYLNEMYKKRLARQKRQKMYRRRRIIAFFSLILIIILLITGINKLYNLIFNQSPIATASSDNPHVIIDTPKNYITNVNYTQNTTYLQDELSSEFAILINLNTMEVVACKNADTKMLPASMTKVMTTWLACETLHDYSDTFTMTTALSDPYYRQGLTTSGFKDQENITIDDLLYSTILHSSADCAEALAIKSFGSEENFVQAEKTQLTDMNLQNTNFINVTGGYDENHYTTAYEMALIMANAMQNEKASQVLSATRYTTSATTQNTDGINYVNQFLMRLQAREIGDAKIIAAKSGYLTPAGSTGCSYGYSQNGDAYVCVCAKAQTSWKTVYDHEYLYKNFAN